MFLENLVLDSVHPRAYGRFWESLLGSRPLTDTPQGYETRLTLPDGSVLDLCFPMVAEPGTASQRLTPVVHHTGPAQTVPGARREDSAADSGEEVGDAQAWLDPQGARFLVTAGPAPWNDAAAGFQLAGVRMQSADPSRDALFWAALTGWTVHPARPHQLQHPAVQGLSIVFTAERAAKPAPWSASTKNAIHLDLRLEADEPVVEAVQLVQRLGGTQLNPEWGELPWQVFLDPSGNEFCILPAPSPTTSPH